MSKSNIVEITHIDDALTEWINGTGKWANWKRSAENKVLEYEFIRKYIPLHVSKKIQYGNFGEMLVVKLLKDIGVECIRQLQIGRYTPDIYTGYGNIEVKTRCFSVSGTAGEKIYCVPSKYHKLASAGFPLIIILVGYQEVEAKTKFELFSNPDNYDREQIALWERHHIYFMYASQIKNEFKSRFCLNKK